MCSVLNGCSFFLGSQQNSGKLQRKILKREESQIRTRYSYRFSIQLLVFSRVRRLLAQCFLISFLNHPCFPCKDSRVSSLASTETSCLFISELLYQMIAFLREDPLSSKLLVMIPLYVSRFDEAHRTHGWLKRQKGMSHWGRWSILQPRLSVTCFSERKLTSLWSTSHRRDPRPQVCLLQQNRGRCAVIS